MSLLGRKRSQEGLEFVGEESRWGSPLGQLPEIEVLEDLLNHAALLDHCDDSKPAATLGAFQSVDFIHLAKGIVTLIRMQAQRTIPMPFQAAARFSIPDAACPCPKPCW